MAHHVIWEVEAIATEIAGGAGVFDALVHTPPADTNHLIIVYATAIGLTSGSSNAWITAAQFVTEGTPTTSRPFPVINIYRQRQDAVWDVDITTDGTDICVELSGDGAEATDWAVYIFLLENHPV